VKIGDPTVRRQRSLDRPGGLNKGEFLAHRNVHRSEDETANPSIEGTSYSIRSERQLMEQLHYNLLYRWFIGLGVDEAVWVPTVFTKNRDRLLEAELGVRWTSAIFRLRTLQLSNPWHSLRVPQGLI
jgi:hypothetical protein